MTEEIEVEVPLSLKRHSFINKAVTFPNELSTFVYQLAISLADPYTQPEENDAHILSVDLLADVIIGLTYTKLISTYPEDSLAANDIDLIKFDMAHVFYQVVAVVHSHFLNVDSELDLRYVDNTEDNWKANMWRWVPSIEYNLELEWLYSACSILVWALGKLFGDNLITNPYFHWLIKLWKCHTNVILLGLEIDRRLEFVGGEEQTPEIVKMVLKGSSAIRYVIAAIINRNPSSLNSDNAAQVNDLEKESLLTFIQPLGREKVNGGAISIDMRLVVIALLILNLNNDYVVGPGPEQPREICDQERMRRDNQNKPILELGDLLLDLEYDDRFDEDIRYIFEYEYDDEDEEDDEWHDDDPEGQLEVVAANPIGADPIDFDEYGHDWRDCPRGDNQEFTPEFKQLFSTYLHLEDKEDSFDFFSKWSELSSTIDFLVPNNIDGNHDAEVKVGQVLLNTISKVNLESASDITVEKIHNLLTEPVSDEDIADSESLIIPIFAVSKFELFMHNNTKLAWCIMDELLCCPGYRRVLIWFLTHDVNISSLHIDYIFELLTGMRGGSKQAAKKNYPYKFTRQGALSLSNVEVSMLLHEFLTNASLYLSARDGLDIEDGFQVVLAESVAKKYMTLLCLMINQLIAKGVINLDRKGDAEDGSEIYDYSNVLQVLLINWVGILPEARQLFFKIKGAHHEIPEAPVVKKKKTKTIDELLHQYQDLSRPEITRDIDGDRNHKALVLRFVGRLGSHISQVRDTNTLSVLAHDDFNLFLSHFNTFSKIDLAAEKLFVYFEQIVELESGVTLQKKEKRKRKR